MAVRRAFSVLPKRLLNVYSPGGVKMDLLFSGGLLLLSRVTSERKSVAAFICRFII